MLCSRLADYMGDDVKYVITEDNWDDTFDTVSPVTFMFDCLLLSDLACMPINSNKWLWARTMIGRRSFAVARLSLWNSLSAALWRPKVSLRTFKRQLKAYLFHIWCVDKQKEDPPPPGGAVVAFFVILVPDTKLPTYVVTYLINVDDGCRFCIQPMTFIALTSWQSHRLTSTVEVIRWLCHDVSAINVI